MVEDINSYENWCNCLFFDKTNNSLKRKLYISDDVNASTESTNNSFPGKAPKEVNYYIEGLIVEEGKDDEEYKNDKKGINEKKGKNDKKGMNQKRGESNSILRSALKSFIDNPNSRNKGPKLNKKPKKNHAKCRPRIYPRPDAVKKKMVLSFKKKVRESRKAVEKPPEDLTNPDNYLEWIKENWDQIEKFSDTKSAPVSEYNSRGKLKNTDDSLTSEKSYNLAYFSELANIKVLNAGYVMHVNWLFSTEDLQGLCDYFGFYCCDHKDHGEDCKGPVICAIREHDGNCKIKWDQLKNCIKTQVLKKLT